jgi:hypothetical protein
MLYPFTEMLTVHDALRQVRELQQKILQKQRFKGYSGRARAISGTFALITAAIVASPYWPATAAAHLTAWGTLFVVAFLLNFGAITYWFLRDPRTKREIRRLKPILDTLPPLCVGAILTIALARHQMYSWLFPVWMTLFGLANLASRHALPPAISIIGCFYVIAGSALLLVGPVSFLNPWPMGIIFFAGEWMGGIVLHFDESDSIADFFHRRERIHAEKR